MGMGRYTWLIWVVNCGIRHVGVTISRLWMRMLLRDKVGALSSGPIDINVDIIISR